MELSVPNGVLWTGCPGSGPSHRLHHDRCRPGQAAQDRTGPVRRSEHRRQHLPFIQLCKRFLLFVHIFFQTNVSLCGILSLLGTLWLYCRSCTIFKGVRLYCSCQGTINFLRVKLKGNITLFDNVQLAKLYSLYIPKRGKVFICISSCDKHFSITALKKRLTVDICLNAVRNTH